MKDFVYTVMGTPKTCLHKQDFLYGCDSLSDAHAFISSYLATKPARELHMIEIYLDGKPFRRLEV
jgi:hypothetical protein